MTEIHIYELAILIESVHEKSQKSCCIQNEIKINNNYYKIKIKIMLLKLSFKNSGCKIISNFFYQLITAKRHFGKMNILYPI
jgi:hypothetical protein